MADYSTIDAWLQRDDDELIYEGELPPSPPEPEPETDSGEPIENTCALGHLFIHWAGGINLETGRSDDAYHCACGAELRVTGLRPEHHFLMPVSIMLRLDCRPTPPDASET